MEAFTRDYEYTHPIFFVVIGMAIGFAIAAIVFNSAFLSQDFVDGLAPEAVGIIVTVAFIERFNRQRDRRQREEEKQRDEAKATAKEKADLIIQMRSKDNTTAINAVELLRVRGWLTDGSLQGEKLRFVNLQREDLSEANLQGVDLWAANLQGARLMGANLQDADLGGANLKGANLLLANLQDADLSAANLQGASMLGANLQGARLQDANLHGTDLMQANLQGADLRDKIFDEQTQLPDATFGNPIYWTPNTDMTRYTHPIHPDFWQSPIRVKQQANNQGE